MTNRCKKACSRIPGLVSVLITCGFGAILQAAAVEPNPGIALGGSNKDFVYASALAPDGSIYVAGQTFSTNFPVTSGTYDVTHNAPIHGDAFIARIRTNPFSIESATFFGGSRQESVRAIVVAPDGSVYVAGDTTSANLPTSSGAYKSSRTTTDRDVWVAKFNAQLSTMQACTYLGGSGYDAAFALALDGNGRVVVAGQTQSTNFPTSSSAYQQRLYGGADGFLSILSSNLSSLQASTLIGANAEDLIYSIAINVANEPYIVGSTRSLDFPTTPFAFDGTAGSGWDAFIARFNSDLSVLSAATLLGYENHDLAYSILLHADGSVYVGGETRSSDFPTTAGAHQRNHAGEYDAFVVKLSANLVVLQASTLLGGEDYDSAYALAADAGGSIFIAGDTYSRDFTTTENAAGVELLGTSDAFLARVSPDLSTLLYSSYSGGVAAEYAYGVFRSSSDSTYLAGTTYSTEFPASGVYYGTVPRGFVQPMSPDTLQVTINPTNRSHSSVEVGGQTIGVTANVSWTATPGVAWITVTGGASGTGDGTVTYSVEANPVTSSRSGTITVEGGGIARTFTVNQAAASLQGSGTDSDPYLISSKADLLAMAANTANYGKYFKMTADIDLAGEVFTSSVIAPAVNASGSPNWSLGTGARFTGSFDGNGHVIRNLTINDPTGLYVGLFGHIEAYGSYPGIVKNLGLENCNISGALISGRGVVGGICGNNFYGHIENCYVTGQVSGQGYVGGICGDNYGGTVSNCFSLCSVSAFWRGGGLCGRNYEGRIENCYAAGPVSGGSEIGGLTGNNNYDGTVSTTLNSFWDTQASGCSTSAGGTGKTTAQMKTRSTFDGAGWDFSKPGIWRMSDLNGESAGYPIVWFHPGLTLLHQVTFDLGLYGARTGGGELIQNVIDGNSAEEPEVGAGEGWMFTEWDRTFDHVTSALHVTANFVRVKSVRSGHKVQATDGAAGNVFGSSTAISGNLAVIGGPNWSGGAGGVYVFERNASGQWGFQTKLVATDGEEDNQFGESVAIDGNTIAVGMPGQASVAGAVCVFIRTAGGDWIQQALLTASDPLDGVDGFGKSVALCGDTVMVGAENRDCVYVFVRSGAGEWTEVQKLTAFDDTDKTEYFGCSVALSGENALIGSYGDNPHGDFSGSAHTFRRDGSGVWRQVSKLTASDGEAGNCFGLSVDLDGEIAVVGAPYDEENGGGRAYLFVLNDEELWAPFGSLRVNGGKVEDDFGGAVAVQGGNVLVGASFESGRGAAYLFTQNNMGQWTPAVRFCPADLGEWDFFGTAVALYGDAVIAGAMLNDDQGEDAGSAYIFDIISVGNPDLFIPESTYSAGAYLAGESLSVGLTATNAGLIAAGPFTLAGVLSINAVWSDANNIVLGENGISGLDAGEALATNVVYNISGVIPAGYYYLGLMIDSTNGITESIETNNVWWSESADIRILTDYRLTVVDGFGGGVYEAGESAAIRADPPAAGKTFNRWTGATQYVAGVTASNTMVTMPASNITVTATYKDILYHLTVTGGSGGGTTYTNGQKVAISANPPTVGKGFDRWTGATQYVGNVTSSTTVVTLPAQDISVTASYKEILYSLTVEQGSGGGISYTYQQQVVIEAEPPPVGYVFYQWTGATQYVSSVTSSVAVVTMPAQDLALSATYRDADTYVLTISGGAGGGFYDAGEIVEILADTPPLGRIFDRWTGDTAQVTDVNAATTTMVMPAGPVSLSAEYRAILYTLTASASGKGRIEPSGEIQIEHGNTQIFTAVPDAGYQVKHWLVGSDVVAEGQSTLSVIAEGDRTVSVVFEAGVPLSSWLVFEGRSQRQMLDEMGGKRGEPAVLKDMLSTLLVVNRDRPGQTNAVLVSWGKRGVPSATPVEVSMEDSSLVSAKTDKAGLPAAERNLWSLSIRDDGGKSLLIGTFDGAYRYDKAGVLLRVQQRASLNGTGLVPEDPSVSTGLLRLNQTAGDALNKADGDFTAMAAALRTQIKKLPAEVSAETLSELLQSAAGE